MSNRHPIIIPINTIDAIISIIFILLVTTRLSFNNTIIVYHKRKQKSNYVKFIERKLTLRLAKIKI